LSGKPFVAMDDFDINLKGGGQDFLGDAMPQPQGQIQVPTTSYINIQSIR